MRVYTVIRVRQPGKNNGQDFIVPVIIHIVLFGPEFHDTRDTVNSASKPDEF